MKKLVLIGGGGHCKSVLDSAIGMKEFDEIVITDAELPVESEILGCRVVGTDLQLPALLDRGYEYAFITVGSITSNTLRKKLVSLVSGFGFQFPVIRDPSASVSSFAFIGEGTFIGKNAIVNADVKVGKHCIINSGAILEHECFVGDFSHISVGSILCGNSHIGQDSFIGAGSTVIQGISIGNQVLVGANSTILSNIIDQTKCYGVVTDQ